MNTLKTGNEHIKNMQIFSLLQIFFKILVFKINFNCEITITLLPINNNLL